MATIEKLSRLSIDSLLSGLSGDGLAGLLTPGRLKSLATFNGHPVGFSRTDDRQKWRVSQLNGYSVVWNDLDRVVALNGRPVRYSELDDQIKRINGFEVDYLHDALDYLKAVRVTQLNSHNLKLNDNGNVVELNGFAVWSEEGRVERMNGHQVFYAHSSGQIIGINGHILTHRPYERPSNEDILMLAVICPPNTIRRRSASEAAKASISK